MGVWNKYICEDLTCPNIELKDDAGHCPECGIKLKKMMLSPAKQLIDKKEIKVKEKEEKAEKKKLKRILFNDTMDDKEIQDNIQKDMENIARQEAGTKWMHAGAMLTFNPTDQIIASGLKAIIDQNKLLIRQNELILRALTKDK